MILLALFLTLLALFTSKSTQTNNYSGRPCFQELPLLQMSTQERNREERLGYYFPSILSLFANKHQSTAHWSKNCFFSGESYFIKATENIFRVCVAWYKHSRGWENSRQLCKPETKSRVCITVSNSPNPSRVYIRLCKHRKKVFYCFYKITFPRKKAKLSCLEHWLKEKFLPVAKFCTRCLYA